LPVVGPADTDKHDAIAPAELAEAAESGGVRFLGERRDVERLYAAMDVFIIASWREGFSRSGMEAAACGCALVLSDISSLRENWEGAAIFLPPADGDKWRAGLGRLIEDRDARERLATAARARARHFTLARTAGRYLALYRELTGGSAERRVA